MRRRGARFRPLLLALLPLGAWGPRAGSPEGVARRFVETQFRSDRDTALTLVTAADRAAATSPANSGDQLLHPSEGSQPFLRLLADRSRITGQTATVKGENAFVTVETSEPAIKFDDLVMSAVLGGAGGADNILGERIRTAELQAHTHTVVLVRENGAWTVDTRWAELAEARRLDEARAAREQQLNAWKQDHLSGATDDYRRAQAALSQVIKAFPDDAGLKAGQPDLVTLLADLQRFKLTVTSTGIDQGEYRILATVHNANAFPLSRLVMKLTFLNGAVEVGSPQYVHFTASSLFSSRLMAAGSTLDYQATGTPPSDWTGQTVHAQVSAFDTDAH
jgi:hypothetical protein